MVTFGVPKSIPKILKNLIFCVYLSRGGVTNTMGSTEDRDRRIVIFVDYFFRFFCVHIIVCKINLNH